MDVAGDRRGELEFNLPDPGTGLIWNTHDYPHSRVRWHHHPEIEFHLITSGTGLMMVGDAVVPFKTGQVSLVGSNLPHNWISDLPPGESILGRDVYCLVRPEKITALAQGFPEAAIIPSLLERSSHGIILAGKSEHRAGQILRQMQDHEPLQRLADVISLLAIFARAPDGDWKTVVTPGFVPDSSPDATDRVNSVIELMASNLSDGVTREDAARSVDMSPSAFSRFFHQATGTTFSELLTKLRLSRACSLLTSTDMPVSRIQAECGYGNASNFNRRFLSVIGMTPSAYRDRYGLVSPAD